MRIERLEIQNFRNIAQAELRPGEGVNLLYGDNAQGKTNLIEAIYLLTGQKGFRPNRESDYIRFGESRAQLDCQFFREGRSQTASLTYLKGGKGASPGEEPQKGGKAAWINGIPSQPSELTGLFCAVVFSPTELALVKEGPALRRGFLDSAIDQVMPRYLKTMATFSRILTQRNSLLFDMSRHPGMEEMLAVWDRSFSKAAYSVLHTRSRYLNRLSPKAAQIYGELSGGREVFQVGYQSDMGGSWDSLEPREGEELIRQALERARGEDLKNGFTTTGPHRDDLTITLDGVSARAFGSQGQQRCCALALKLAECAVIREITGEQPIILLDDVLSELDKTRRDYFLSGPYQGQMFITCCDRAGFRSVRSGVTMRVKGGAIRSRREIGGS